MAVAFGNVNTHTTPWVASPSVRGSWEILSSCVITISLCVWTALHLNVPEHGTASRLWKRKTKWLLLGLVAPEMVVFVAWRQRREAKRVLRDVRNHLGQEFPRSRFHEVLRCCHWTRSRGATEKAATVGSPATAEAKFSVFPVWTMVHAFYAVMGGFALESSTGAKSFLPGDRKRAALTSDGLRFLLEHEPDMLPDISQDQIRDKSKADGLKKLLVCAQALWFCASCITRLVQNLPISLLELNAVGHAACALLIYAMWWHKPLDISEPTLIQDSRLPPLLAYMWMTSGVSAKSYNSYDMHGRLRDELDAIWMFRYPRVSDIAFGDSSASGLEAGQSSVLPRQDSRKSEEMSMLYRHYTAAPALNPRYRFVTWLHSCRFSSWLGVRFPAGLGSRTTAIDHLSLVDTTRWRLALEAIEKYNLEHDLLSRYSGRSGTYDEEPRVDSRIQNTSSLIGSRPYEAWFGFAVAGVLYGGLHMLAWKAPFSSRLERICWQIAASSVTITPLLLAPLALVLDMRGLGQGGADFMKLVQGQSAKAVGGGFLFWMRIVLVVLIFPLIAIGPLLCLLYICGRIFLVVECFKNLAHLPSDAFRNVAWSSYIPHVT